MEIRHLKLVKTIAEVGTLTQAAKKLYLTQSALSHQLKELEKELGTSVFRRINKKLVFTAAGEKILSSADSILNQIEQIQSDVSSLTSEKGTIRVSTECYTCYHWLPSIMRMFNEKHPQVEIIIDTESTRKPIEALQKEKIDIGITSRKYNSDNLKYFNLFEDRMLVVMNNTNTLSKKKSITPQDFQEQILITYDSDENNIDILSKVLTPAGIRPQKILKVQLTEAIIEIVKAGMGITVMAEWAVKPYLHSSNLTALPLSNKKLNRKWYAVTIKDNFLPGYVKDFINELQNNNLSD